MTSISAPTYNGCDQLTTRYVLQPRRPRITVATSKDGHHILRQPLRTLPARLRAIFGTRGRDNLTNRQALSQDNMGSKASLLARAFAHPDGVGFIGPGADALLRGVFTEALASKTDVAQVITTHADLDRLFGEAINKSVTRIHAPRLRIMGSLEEAIEHLELEAETTEMISATSAPLLDVPAVVWLATPGPDADVVQEVLRRWPDNSLIALLAGPWPYGPNHLIEETGPRPLPDGPIPLPSPQEAIKQLSTQQP
ncbi:hypothetical protein [Actinomadura welshii]|uniref:hypothetical protein n=1 Tax=Actinomadura welshii TaxID=3103817 RepID=UPI0003AD3021|nr:hypothetical protein [Actinomadura madurae]